MKLETFFDNFELLADAPNEVQKLRELILQLAVQGKLVPQDSNDEPASVLLDKIKAEKEKLVKEKKISKPELLPPISLDKKPFHLAKEWEWVYLEQISNLIHYGYTASANYNVKEVRLLRITDIQNNKVNWTSVPGCEIDDNKLESYMLSNGDILIARTGGTIGKSYLVESLSICAVFASYLIRIIPSFQLLPKYLKLFLESELYWKQLYVKSMGTGQPNVNATSLKSLIVPLPPLEEQKRIVTKVDQLMTLCDRLEEHQQKRRRERILLNNAALDQLLAAHEPEDFSKHWQRICNNFDLLYSTPESISKLRQTILQLAVQGKLVPQDSNDEPASVLLEKIKFEKEQLVKEGKIGKFKKLPPVNVDEIPYQLPKTWQLTRLAQIISLMDAGWSPACKNHPTKDEITWGVLKTTAVQELEYKQEEHKELPEDLYPRSEYEVKPGDILITRAGPKNRVGICCLVKNTRSRLMISDKIIRFHLIDRYILPDFIALSLNSGFSQNFIETQKSGMAASQMNISQDKLKMTPISIPPLNEQKRIVAKVNQLMVLCDELEAKLIQTVTNSEKLMDTAIRHLLTAYD